MEEQLVCSQLEILYSVDLSNGVKKDGYCVIATAPFLKGHISLDTEVAIILLPEIPKKVEAFNHREIPKPEVSDADYLCTVSVRVLDDHASFPKNANGVVVESDHTDGVVVESDHTVFVSQTFAAKYGLKQGHFVRVKLQDNVKRKSRYMQIYIAEDLSNESSVVQLSPIAWFNLGATPSTGQGNVKLKKFQIDRSSSGVLASGCHAWRPGQIPIALHMKIARVRLSDTNITRPIPQRAIKIYFCTERYMRVGDMFVIKEPDDADVNKHTLTLFKVFEINKSPSTTHTYAVHSEDCELLVDISKHSFIPPSVAHHGVGVGRSLKSLREGLLKLLAPFVQHKRPTTPLPFVILGGPEGSGKSAVIRQIAKLFQCNYLEENSMNLVADTVNSTEYRIKDILHKSSSTSPVVLLLRNINMLTKEETANAVENPRVAQYFQTQLVKTMEESDWPIIVFGTCEKLNTVSEAIREAALQEVVVQSPNAKERLDMLEEFTEGLDLSLDVYLQHIADHTAGFIYGDIKALVTNAERNSVTRAYAISKIELGSVCEKSIRNAGILLNSHDFQQGLDKIQSVQSSDLGAPKIPNVKWSDIGGLQKVKEDILDTIQLPLKHPELFTSAMRRSGVLLYGPPGTGKTLLAKAVATECALNFFSVKGPELINMYVGQSEENIRQVFQKARSASPCVIFFDELDSLAPNRGRSGDSGGVMDRVVSQLLAELDGLVKSSDVFVIGATNRPDLLDPALLRPGRFDKLVYVGICVTAMERRTILEAVARKFSMEADCDLDRVSKLCPDNMTGADLYSLCAEAMTNAIKRQIDKVEGGTPIEDCKLTVKLVDFELAVKQTTPSLSAEEILRYEKVRLQFSMDSDKQEMKDNADGNEIAITDV